MDGAAAAAARWGWHHCDVYLTNVSKLKGWMVGLVWFGGEEDDDEGTE